MPIASLLRSRGVRTELFPDAAKTKKQMAYANAKHIPYVVLCGANEMEQGKVTLKDMMTGEQQLVTPDELAELICR